ncbi:MAG: hypothetical protein HQM10_18985 [Candidatus Riflebacteria bacterium]|nr:hypothetical protein [Candidatus Riflebacteria bacterium]
MSLRTIILSIAIIFVSVVCLSADQGVSNPTSGLTRDGGNTHGNNVHSDVQKTLGQNLMPKEESIIFHAAYTEVQSAKKMISQATGFSEHIWAVRPIRRAEKQLSMLPLKTYNDIKVADLQTAINKAKVSLLLGDWNDSLDKLQYLIISMRWMCHSN